jgi:hypothetical protein
MKFNFIFLILLLTLLSCDPMDDTLVIKNKSDQILYYVKNSHAKLSELYKEDTLTTYLNYVHEVGPNTIQNQLRMGRRGKAWKGYISKTCEDGKLRIYTFSIDTLKKYSFRDVIDHDRYLQKKEFKVSDLEKSNWVITFP